MRKWLIFLRRNWEEKNSQIELLSNLQFGSWEFHLFRQSRYSWRTFFVPTSIKHFPYLRIAAIPVFWELSASDESTTRPSHWVKWVICLIHWTQRGTLGPSLCPGHAGETHHDQDNPGLSDHLSRELVKLRCFSLSIYDQCNYFSWRASETEAGLTWWPSCWVCDDLLLVSGGGGGGVSQVHTLARSGQHTDVLDHQSATITVTANNSEEVGRRQPASSVNSFYSSETRTLHSLILCLYSISHTWRRTNSTLVSGVTYQSRRFCWSQILPLTYPNNYCK